MKKKSNKLWVVIAVIIVIAVAIFLVPKLINKQDNVKLTEIAENDIKYYKLRKDEKTGIIDKEGNIVIEPKYADIHIPNPTTDLFICTTSNNYNNSDWKAYNSKNEQILTNYASVEAISINQLTSTVPYEKNVLKYKEGNLYGLVDFQGKKILPANYEEISNIDYKEGYLKVKKEGFYGVVTIEGKTILKPEYSDILADGYYNASSKYSKAGFLLQTKSDDGYKYGYAKPDGKVIVENNYSEISRINEINDDKNIYLISSSNGKYGLLKNGKILLENEYDDIEYDRETNLLVISKGIKQGAYNIEGKEIIPMEYDLINIGGDYINAVKEGNRTVFDSNGNKLDTDFYSHLKASNNYSVVIDSQNNYNIVDTSNNLLLKDKYIYIEYYKNDLFIATQETNSGLINANGNIVVPLKYSTLQKIDGTELLKATTLENNKIDLINASGTVIEGCENSKIEKKNNYIKIYSDSETKYFDLNGNQKTYQELYPGNKMFASSKNGKWGFVNGSGNVVVDYTYDMVTELNGKVAGVKKGDLWGVIDENGKIIIEPKYKIDWSNVVFLSTYYEINNVGEKVYSGDVIE